VPELGFAGHNGSALLLARSMKFKYKGEMREALVHVPSTPPGHKTRVILNYHGLGCNGPQQARYTGMAKLGTREGFAARPG
jgi:poly(3-hydroxybutyrate) depolymerase